MKINEKLKMLRQENKIFQCEIANLLNVTQQTYSRYELGKLEVSNDNLKILAIFYNVSIDYLFGLTNIRDPKWNQIDNDPLVKYVYEKREKIFTDHPNRPKIGRPKKRKEENKLCNKSI